MSTSEISGDLLTAQAQPFAIYLESAAFVLHMTARIATRRQSSAWPTVHPKRTMRTPHLGGWDEGDSGGPVPI